MLPYSHTVYDTTNSGSVQWPAIKSVWYLFSNVKAQWRAHLKVYETLRYEKRLMDDGCVFISVLCTSDTVRIGFLQVDTFLKFNWIKYGIVLIGIHFCSIVLILSDRRCFCSNNYKLVQTWKNELLSWNSSDYGDCTFIWLPAHTVWTPDIVLYNRWDSQITVRKKSSRVPTNKYLNWLNKSVCDSCCIRWKLSNETIPRVCTLYSCCHLKSSYKIIMRDKSFIVISLTITQ